MHIRELGNFEVTLRKFHNVILMHKTGLFIMKRYINISVSNFTMLKSLLKSTLYIADTIKVLKRYVTMQIIKFGNLELC